MPLTEQEIQERLRASEGEFTDDPNHGQNQEQNDFVPSPAWDYLKAKLPEAERESFKLPEGITKENENELLDKQFESIYSKAPTIDTLHPLAKEIQEMATKVENFDATEFIKQKAGIFDYGKLSLDEKVKNYYAPQLLKSEQNPNGLTEEELTQRISKLNELDKEVIAKKYDEVMKKEIEDKYASRTPKNILTDQDMRKEYEKQVDNHINSIFKPEAERGDKAVEIRSIAGIDIGESNFQAFKEEYRKSLLPNEKGVIELAVKQRDDNAMFEFALYQRFKGIIKDAIVKAKTEGKLGAINQLPLEPPAGGGTTQQHGTYSDAEISERLKAPEGTY